MKTVRLAILLLAGLLLAGVACQVIGPSPTSAVASPPHSQQDVIADVAESVLASVVNISSTRVLESSGLEFGPFQDDPFFRHFFGPQIPEVPHEFRQSSLGSGVVASADGVVLTNNHVVERAEEVKVTLSDGRQFDAVVTGTDPRSDLAVLKLKGASGLRPLPFGDSDALRLGETVLAVGNPFGLQGTVTMGIVSAKGRSDVGIVDYEDFIQTDAAINPGNSGGAVVNLRGELVGVATAILSRTGGYQGIGFAIPSRMAQQIMESLLSEGRVARGWLGVMIQDLVPDLALAFDVEGTEGVLVGDVQTGSPAEDGGMKRGDVIVRLEDEPMRSASQLRNAIGRRAPGTKVQVEVVRGDARKTLTIRLGELPAEEGEAIEVHADMAGSAGMRLVPLDDAARERFDVPVEVRQGVVVGSVDPGSLASEAGLRPGDVILEVGRKPVASVDAFHEEWARGAVSLLLVWRDGNTHWVVVERD